MPSEYTKHDREVNVRAGDEFVVALESNPTAGYEWNAGFDKSVLELLNEPAPDADAAPVGARSIQRFRWRALAAGKTTLHLTYKRGWDATPLEDVVFRVVIQARN